MAISASTFHGKVIGGVAIVLLLAAGVLLVRPLFKRSDLGTPKLAYYTCDEGATLFSDQFNRVPPFEHDGQQAVRAHVYSCDGNKTHFVGFLEKYDSGVLNKQKEAIARGESPLGYDAGPFVKKAGSQFSHWAGSTEREYVEATMVAPPEGMTGTVVEVFP